MRFGRVSTRCFILFFGVKWVRNSTCTRKEAFL